MIMCVLLCYPVSIRIYYQQGGRFLVAEYIARKLLKMALEVEYMEYQAYWLQRIVGYRENPLIPQLWTGRRQLFQRNSYMSLISVR